MQKISVSAVSISQVPDPVLVPIDVPLIRSAYGPKLVVGIDCSVEPSMTKQEFKDECDINVLMARYERTGVLDWVNEVQPNYGVANPVDFQVALNTVIEAQSMFDSMPGTLRARFQNDPAVFLTFMDDPKNVDESIKLGLRLAPKPEPEPTIQKVQIVPSTPVPVPSGGSSPPSVGGNAEG